MTKIAKSSDNNLPRLTGQRTEEQHGFESGRIGLINGRLHHMDGTCFVMTDAC